MIHVWSRLEIITSDSMHRIPYFVVKDRALYCLSDSMEYSLRVLTVNLLPHEEGFATESSAVGVGAGHAVLSERL